jgi:hypothetical protein
MADYTESEVQAAVEKIVRGSVRTSTGILGESEVGTSFNDIQEAAAGVFILSFNAPYYVAYLGSRRLVELVEAEAEQLELLLDLVSSLDRLVTPVKNITTLANAKAALGELSGAVEKREKSFSDFEQVPSWRRYAQNVDEFISQYGGNIKQSGSVVETPSAARKAIPALARGLSDSHSELVRRAGLLAGALEDFDSLDLPGVAAQGVISRSRDVLDERYDELEELDENERLDVLKEVVLDLLTQKPVVREYGAARKPTPYLSIEGTGTPFSDSTRLAEPAYVDSDVMGPYTIIEGYSFIRVTLQGSTVVDYPLLQSFVASLTGVLSGPYLIDASNGALKLEIEGTEYSIPLAYGTKTAAAVAGNINSIISGTDTVAEAVLFPQRIDTLFDVTDEGGGTYRFTLIAGTLEGYGITAGDEADIISGPDSGTTVILDTVNEPGGWFEVTAGLTVATGVRAQVGSVPRALRLRDTNEQDSVDQRRRIVFVPTGGIEDYGAMVLGFGPGFTAQSRPTLAREVADNINESISSFQAERIVPNPLYTGSAHSSLENPAVVVLSKLQASGAITGGVLVTFPLTSAEAADAGIGLGDYAVIRSSLTAGDIGKVLTVASIQPTYVQLVAGTSITAGNVDLEFGPSHPYSYGYSLEITSGPNQGLYYALEDRDLLNSPLEVRLNRNLPVYKLGNTELEFSVVLGAEGVRFSSADQTVSSEIELDNVPGAAPVGPSSGADLFFSSPPESARGYTSYIQLPENPRALAVGDILELYEAQYNIISRSWDITEVYSDAVITLSDTFESNGTMEFGTGLPVPFARIRVLQTADYDAFKERLDDWMGRTEQQESYFRELDRLLNAILVNKNPTKSQVSTVRNHLRKLSAWLTESGASSYGGYTTPNAQTTDTLEYALNQYVSNPVDSVDDLIRTFNERSADRATDILLECRFTDFFGLDVEEVTYGGKLQKSIRETAREDMPVRKFKRQDVFKVEKVLGSWPDPDYEYDISDADKDVVPDPPVGLR